MDFQEKVLAKYKQLKEWEREIKKEMQCDWHDSVRVAEIARKNLNSAFEAYKCMDAHYQATKNKESLQFREEWREKIEQML